MLSLLCIILAAFPQGPASSQPAPTTQPQSVQSLIDKLADPNPQVRDDAAQEIVALGAPARPAVVTAWRSHDPRISPRAAKLLLQLPWSIASDPPAVRQLLADYGAKDEEARLGIAIELAKRPGCGPTLIRLLREDPSDVVSWTSYVLLVRLQDDEIDAKLRALDVADERVPVIVAAGRAWLGSDWNKGLEILRRAIDAEQAHPTRDLGYLAFAFDLLAAEAVEGKRFDEAADWRRREARRGTSEGDASAGMLGLFALHGDFGPLAGFDEDLQTFEDDLGRAEVLYAMAHLQDRAGQSLLAIGLRQAALCANLVSPDAHATTASWLAEQSWTADARREYYAALSTGHANAPPAKALIDSGCMYQLAQLAAEAGDDATAAEQFAAAQDLIDKQSQPDPRLPLSSTIHRHRLRLAQRAKDDKSAKKELEAILAEPQADPDASIDAIAMLREQGRDDEASRQFERAYSVQKARLAAEPVSAQEMNNLAWLCARCREHVPEAIEMSARATRLAPESHGYWDTAAEAQFAAGNCAEAARFESRALGLKPNDPFMTRQLARFRQGADK